MSVFIEQCSCVYAHLAFVDGLKGCKLRVWIQHLSMNKCIPVTPTYSHLGTVFSSANSGHLLSTYSCGVRPLCCSAYCQPLS